MKMMNLKARIKSNSKSAKLVFFGVVVISTLVVLFSMPRITLPLVFAYIISFLLRPIIPKITKLVVKKDLAILITFIGLGFAIVYPIVKLTPTIQEESQNFQYYVPKIKALLTTQYDGLREKVLEKVGFELPHDLITNSLSMAEVGVKNVLLKIPNLIASLLEWLLLVPLFLFFFVRDGRKLKYAVLRYVPNQIFERTYYLFYQFNRQIGDYIFAKFVEASIVGLIITIGLYSLDVRFAFMLGIAAGVTNIIPYIGPFIGAVPALIVAFIDYGISPGFGAVIILYAVANVIDLAFVFPILVSKIVDLHPVIVVVSVIVGSQYMGIAGMIVSIPLAASLKLILREVLKELYPENSRVS